MRLLLLIILFSVLKDNALGQIQTSNSIEIMNDSTNRYAWFKISRIKEKYYALSFFNDKNQIIYEANIKASGTPTDVLIPWAEQPPGIYKAILKNKREVIQLLFIKKELSPPSVNSSDSIR